MSSQTALAGSPKLERMVAQPCEDVGNARKEHEETNTRLHETTLAVQRTIEKAFGPVFLRVREK